MAYPDHPPTPAPSPSLMGPDTNPRSGMNGWQVEASPPNAGAFGLGPVKPMFAVRIVCTSGLGGNLAHLNDTGLLAVQAQFASYLTAAKMAEIRARDKYRQNPTSYVSPSTCWLDCLPEDGPAQIAALCAIFQTAANITTKW